MTPGFPDGRLAALRDSLRPLWVLDAREGRGPYVRQLSAVVVLSVLLEFTLEGLDGLLQAADAPDFVVVAFFGVVEPVLSILLMWWLFSATVRRLHDRGRPGGWAACAVFPPFFLILSAALAVLGARPEGRRWPELADSEV